MDAEIRLMLLEKARAGDTQAALVLAVVDLRDTLQEGLWEVADALRCGSGADGEPVHITMQDEIN
jgi:hypothetical protein